MSSNRNACDSRIDLYEKLRHDLIAGHYRAGEKLAIARLQQRYDVGLSPLRETLNRLAAIGLLEQSHQRGFRVPALNRAALDDVATLRLQLEGEALIQSIHDGDEEWEVALVSALHRLKQYRPVFHTPAQERWECMHADFHRALVSKCGSRWRLRFLDQLYDQFDRYRRCASPDEHTRERLDAQHEQLVEYALARDAERARSLLKDHIKLSWAVAAHSCTT